MPHRFGAVGFKPFTHFFLEGLQEVIHVFFVLLYARVLPGMGEFSTTMLITLAVCDFNGSVERKTRGVEAAG